MPHDSGRPPAEDEAPMDPEVAGALLRGLCEALDELRAELEPQAASDRRPDDGPTA
jgi:hypothetical protein